MRLNCIRPKRPYQTAETADENLRIVSKKSASCCLECMDRKSTLSTPKWLFRSGTSKWEFPIFPYSSRPLDHARQNSKAKLQVPRRWPHHGDAKRKPRQRDGRGSTRFDTSVRHSRTLTPSKLFMKTEIKITTRIFNSRKTAGKRSHCLNQRGWSHGNWMQFM